MSVLSVHTSPGKLAAEKRQLLRHFETTLEQFRELRNALEPLEQYALVTTLDHFRKLEEAGDTYFLTSGGDILFDSAELRVLAGYTAAMNASLGALTAALLEVASQSESIAQRPATDAAGRNQTDEIDDIADGKPIDSALQRLKRVADMAEQTLAERKRALRQMARNEQKINSAQAKNAELLHRLLSRTKNDF